MSWTDDVARFVLDAQACPRCHTRAWQGGAAMRAGVCARCGADLRGDAGAVLWQASEELVRAARRRQELVDALPTAAFATARAQAAPTSPAPTGAAAFAETASVPVDAAPFASSVTAVRPRSTVSLQSVLAVVGAGLLAVAAIVFTFLNPDLTDFATRTTIIAIVTAVFLGGAWLLHRRQLQFSAEAVGALGMVFLALDVWAVSRLAPEGLSGWYFGALGLLVSAGAMVAVGTRLRMRTWLWAGLLGVALVPAFLGYGAEAQGVTTTGWAATWGHVGVLFAAWALLELTRPVGRRLGSRMRADRAMLSALQLAAIASSVPMSLLFARGAGESSPSIPVAGVLAALSLGALLSTRRAVRRLWSVLGTLLLSGSLLAAALAVPMPQEEWTLASLAIAAALPVVAVALASRTGSISRPDAAMSALVVALLVAFPSLLLLGGNGLQAAVDAWSRRTAGSVDPEVALLSAVACLALAVTAAGVWVLSMRVDDAAQKGALAVLSRWLLVPVAAGLPLAIPGPIVFVVAASLALSVAASLLLLLVARVRESRLALRAPVLTVAYGAILEAVAFSWPDARLAAVAGAVAVAAFALVTRTAPPALRPLHTALGFGYALVAGAAALSLTELGELPVLCLLTSGAALVAIAASLSSWPPVGSWYAILGVTAVPFGIGIVSVLIERSGWTALSSTVILLLAVTLLLTRRTGAGMLIRAGAAALIVPTLAVVVVCLTAEFLTVSGSPYALVIIAAIVACALPTTGLLRAGLLRSGFPEATADAVRRAVEASSLVTGALAVVLALVRAAAGFEIAFVVLLVLGIGAAATAFWMKRRYGWWTAAAAWTGALWCAWAMIGVAVVEPFLLPPAVAAITVGTVLLARGRSPRSAAALVATGLGVAVAPSLALLALTGNGTGTSFEQSAELWRVGGLLAAGVVLTVVAGLITRPSGMEPTRFEAVRRPLLLSAVVAAAAGPVEGVRLGWELDPLPVAGLHPLLQSLLVSALGAAIAAAAARLAVTGGMRSRWLFAPAWVFLAVGPMAAIEDDPFSIWALWALELLLLAAMIATAWRARERAVTVPPVWFQWALAWCVAVTAWSQREVLRVEGFALPLGLALVLVGALAFTRGVRPGDARTPSSWPIGFRGSWATLGLGLVATLLPSIMATFTDPQTWRAILVIALALVAVLVGARKTLAAPFILGISALPLEILVVFLVQLGEAINPLLWWITLATAGIVLLVIAVGWERRTGADASLGARIRDLR